MLFFCANSFHIATKALHILHISSALSWRGGERQISFLAEELQKRGIRQVVLCARESKMADWCSQNGIPYSTYKKTFSLNPYVAWRICQLDKRLSFSHLHTHDSHSHTFTILAVSLFGVDKPIIVHRRVDFPIKNNWLSKWKYNHASIKAIICVSDFIRKLIEPAIKHKKLIRTIHSGIDLALTPTVNAQDLHKEFNVPQDYSIIINLAAIAPHKDYFTFVDTAEILLSRGLRAKFLLIGGDGGELSEIKRYIQKKGLENDLILTGFRKDVPAILSQVDLLLFTSKTEGLGGAILDAFKAGVPIVTTAVGGVMEIVEHNVSGLVAPVGDARALADQVEIVLTDKDLQARLIKNGKEKVMSFSKEKNAEKIIEVYQETIQNG